MLRIDFDSTAGLCRVFDSDGDRSINGFRVDVDLPAGSGTIIIDSKSYQFKELYLNAKGVTIHEAE